MTPEMKAKPEELVKNGRVQELDPDSMARVSGGGAMTVNVMGEEMTREEI